MPGLDLALGLEPVVHVAPVSAATLQVQLVGTPLDRLLDGFGGGLLLLPARGGRPAHLSGDAILLRPILT